MSLPRTGQMARVLARREDDPRPECETVDGNLEDEYNTPLHVVALLVVLFVSFTACAFPLIVIKYPRLRIPSSFLFSARHFGTGVLIATAFAHLLPTAFVSLTDPCLPRFWTDDYPAMAGAIALGAVFLVTLIEMLFSPGHHCMAVQQQQLVTRPDGTIQPGTSPQETPDNRTPKNGMGDKLRRLGPIRGRSTSVGRELQRMSAQVRQMDQIEDRGEAESVAVCDEECDGESAALPDDTTTSHEKLDVQPMTDEQKHKKALMQCMLLEMGILFHSVFIGMALSVSIGGDFVMLWIAISFHREYPSKCSMFSIKTPLTYIRSRNL